DHEMCPRGEDACYRRRRRTTYSIKTQRYWHSAGCTLNLLWEFRRFDNNEIDAQFFNFGDKLGSPNNTYNFEIARFCNRDQASRDRGVRRIYDDPVFRLELHKFA